MNAITYSRQGDYLIPDLTLPTEQEIPLGRYAQMHRSYLEQHKRVTYLNLCRYYYVNTIRQPRHLHRNTILRHYVKPQHFYALA